MNRPVYMEIREILLQQKVELRLALLRELQEIDAEAHRISETSMCISTKPKLATALMS